MDKLPKSASLGVKCHGRGITREEVLTEDVSVAVWVRVYEDGKSIGISVDCPHNTGSHGQKCKASGKRGVLCPYAVDLPHVVDTPRGLIGAL